MQLATHPEAQRLFGLAIEEMSLRILHPPPTMSLSEWAEKNRTLSPTIAWEAGPYRLSRAPYLREIMDAFTDPAVRELVVLKGSRLGVTEGLINIPIGYIIDLDPGPILIVWPTKEDAQEWSKETLPDLFDTTECLRGKVRDAGEKDSDQTILHKSFAGGWLTAGGSNSARFLRRRNARFVFIDEYDACDEAKTSKEGDIGARAARRADTYADAKIVKTGSPKFKPTSRIWRDWLNSDQREIHVPCPHCAQLQMLLWSGITWEKDLDSRGRVTRQHPETAHYTCRHCGAVIEEKDKRWMVDVDRVKWIPANPGHAVRGYKITTLLSLFPNATWAQLATEWIKAQGDRELLMTFLQTVLAEPWEDHTETPETEQLVARRETYVAEVPAGVGVLTAAVDIQDDRLELLIKGWGIGQESWDIEHHRVHGDPDAADQAVWKTLDRLVFRRFQHELGAQLTVRAVCVDTGDHTDAAYRYCRHRRKLGVFPVKGERIKQGKPTIIRPGKARLLGMRLFLVADDRLKRNVLRRLRIQEPGPGYIHFPVAQASGLDDEYLEQFKNEVVRPRTRADGTVVYEFIRRGANEAIDLQKMNLAGLYILGDGVLNYLPQLVARVAAEGAARGGPASVKAAAIPAAERPLEPVRTPRRRGRVRFRGFGA